MSTEPSSEPGTGDTAEQPAETPAGTPAGTPTQQPAGTPSNQPASTPGDTAAERPAEAPTGDTAAERPAEAPTGDTAAERPAEAPTEPIPATAAPGRRRSRLWLIGGAVVLVCLAIVAIGVSLALSEDEHGGNDGNDGTTADPEDHTASAAIDGREQAELHLVSGAEVVTVRTEAMGDTLYQVSTPPDGDSVPRTVERGDRIEVHLAESGEPGPSSVEIVLTTEVEWTVLRFSGGANEQVVDLTGGSVGELDFAAGASRIEVTLPVPEGTVPIRVGSGAGELLLQVPPDVPVQATLHSGAGQVVIDDESHSGVAPETVFTPDDWEQVENRYDLDASGLGQLTVTRTAA